MSKSLNAIDYSTYRYALCLFVDTQFDDGRRRRSNINLLLAERDNFKNIFHFASLFKFIHRNRVVVPSFVCARA